MILCRTGPRRWIVHKGAMTRSFEARMGRGRLTPGVCRIVIRIRKPLATAMKLFRFNVLILLAVAFAGAVAAQGTAADYRRAEEMRTKFVGLVPNAADEPNFSEDNKTLVYRRTL